MNKILFLFSLVLLGASCNTSKNPLFGKRSAHEQYGEAISKSGLKESALGRAWFAAAETALADPQQISLPYKETGFFASDKPSAAGYIFKTVRGENIVATLTLNPDSVQTFLELWRRGTNEPSYISSMDTLTKSVTYTIKKEDSLLIRIQPELLVDLEYTLTISTQPSLAFPVAKGGKPRMISFWGNPRDAGARSHEGVDIGAAFRTPALAATDGIISMVNENNLGGKVVFLRDANTGDNLYYAHLDSQIVVQGQRVKRGDTIGLIGNTGNAKNTPPHLHFGIYTIGGAINPLPFINPEVKEPSKISASLEMLNRFLRASRSTSLYAEPSAKSARIQTVEKEEPVYILAATTNWYKVKSLSNEIGYVSSQLLTSGNLRQFSLKQSQKLKTQPMEIAPAKLSIDAGENVEVRGVYKDFYLVKYKEMEGWMSKGFSQF